MRDNMSWHRGDGRSASAGRAGVVTVRFDDELFGLKRLRMQYAELEVIDAKRGTALTVGTRVRHRTFGEGTVTAIDGPEPPHAA